MKKYLQYANYFVVASGVMGAFLLKNLLRAGEDAQGLYPAAHSGWIGYLALTVATLAILWFVTRKPEIDPTWQRNYPKNTAQRVFCCAGYALAAAGVGIYGRSVIPSTLFAQLSYWGSFVCMAALLVLAVQHFAGKAPFALLHPVIFLYFVLQMFLRGRANASEPEFLRYLPQMFALGASALAGYQLWGFAVDCGNREKSLFWSLSACYLCLAAAAYEPALFAGLGLWHLLSHPTLTLPPVEMEEIPEAEEPEEIIEEEIIEENL